VAGIFRAGTAQFDRTRMYLHLADLQRFIHLHDRVHEIALIAESPEHAEVVARDLARALDGSDLLVRSWQEIRPDIYNMVQVSQASSSIMVFIIYFVAVLGVVNTMLMSVFERTRELGVLKAIGLTGRRIVAMIVTETLFLVLVSAAAGTLLGFGLVLYMAEYGIDLSSMTGGFTLSGVGIEPVLRGTLTARGLIMPTVILSLMCFVASLYPAIRAARLRPAVGMRET
jgi:ABC-type lipoprotein release transport system permease subunit